ncbi:hypothetical protein FN846DRAFT_959077 [Sphaerosporella brunnea]|uniref:Phytocyanin domain-containing protein n=1 Tax=Sphaerosporella brunnea TaxID=1250544 RepID=A0A5J5ERA7_9PEZI|nr:hypothetical protein FN846DRAFT_959077 [Sphaerosporella brunnea]
MKLAFAVFALLAAVASATNHYGHGNSTHECTPKTITEVVTTTVTENEHYRPTPRAAAPRTFNVKVGGKDAAGVGILRYSPEVVYAEIGDTIVFDFLFRNHTVTESTFDSPCVKKAGGFASGFRPNLENKPGTSKFTYKVVDKKPHWVYCGQKQPKPHCQAGMVFAVNPPSGTFQQFVAKAKAARIVARAPKKIQVVVGGKPSPNAAPLLRYTPETVDANPGDVIEFNFRANAHTVTQSSFENPCKALDGGFKTGLQENPTDTDRKIIRTFTVPRTGKPLWFYCGAPGHCKKGMVFAINAGGKFKEFQKKAMSS